MKINTFLLALSLVMFLSFCKKKEDYFISLKVAHPFSNEAGAFGAENSIPIEGAEIWVYKSENDYLQNQNVAFHGVSNVKGEFSFKDRDEFNYFFKVKKDTLNEKRFMKEYINHIGSGSHKKANTKTYFLPLSTTPTKLQLKIIHKGQPVKDAEVQIYYSENDYINDNPPIKFNSSNREFDSKSYGILFEKSFFLKLSDINGIAYFDSLEPREYWFRVKAGEKNNFTTVFRTEGKLKDNSDIPNVLKVEIN